MRRAESLRPGGYDDAIEQAVLVLHEQKRYAEARAWQEEALALRREVGDRWAVANSLNNLGNVAMAQGDYAAARGIPIVSDADAYAGGAEPRRLRSAV